MYTYTTYTICVYTHTLYMCVYVCVYIYIYNNVFVIYNFVFLSL